MFKPCLIIPIYKHTKELAALDAIFSFVPAIMIDDGNIDDDRELLKQIADKHNACLIHNSVNLGKGAAVLAGFKEALRQGYTHALQIDADGQHDLSAVDRFLEAACNEPQKLINSYPIYDDSASAIRRHGHKLTNFWVRLETRSNAIYDAMCGFRVYPLKEIEPELNTIHFKRMGFDIEIVVKAYWRGIDIINLPVNVHYPVGGHSNYRGVADNIKISFMHAYLFCLQFIKNRKNYD